MDISQGEPPSSNNAPVDVRQPFTKAERMQQLSEIDQVRVALSRAPNLQC